MAFDRGCYRVISLLPSALVATATVSVLFVPTVTLTGH